VAPSAASLGDVIDDLPAEEAAIQVDESDERNSEEEPCRSSGWPWN